MKTLYYVYRYEKGDTGNIVKKEDGLYYLYKDGKWLEFPELIKIEFEITNYEEITKDEALALIKKQDNYDYEEQRNHEDYVLDGKERKHNVYIYQDYRSIDGISVDDGFDYQEVMYREDYEYYFDKDNKSLHKKNIETEKCYEFVVREKNNKYHKEWLEVKDFGSRVLVKITNIEKVLEYINDYYFDSVKGKADINIKLKDIVD